MFNSNIVTELTKPGERWKYFFKAKKVNLFDKYERWKKVAEIFKISRQAKQRLEWIIYYCGKSEQNAAKTARYFGISRKTFYKWFNIFDEKNLYTLQLLEDTSKAPHKTRKREITPLEEIRIIRLRKKYIRYGKMKLAEIYGKTYKEKISSWKVQKVIEEWKLYYNPLKQAKINKKKKSQKKKRTIELISKLPNYKKKAGYIICLDTIEYIKNGIRRHIFTAIDK